MKNIIYSVLLCSYLLAGCDKSDDVIDRKEGISLPAVESLTLQKIDANKALITWSIPSAIPSEIETPLAVVIEVKEVVNANRVVPVFNTTLADGPTQFEYEVPDPLKVYRITVKLNGHKKSNDPNYSSNILSLGQTVQYN